jgi:hypothetical protein
VAATLTCIEKAGFREMRLMISGWGLNLKIKCRQGTDGAHMSRHIEDISQAVIACNILLQIRQNNWKISISGNSDIG